MNLFFFFSQFYWEVIDIHHAHASRRIAGWFDLHINCEMIINRFLTSIMSYRYNFIKEKNFPVMRTLNFPVYHTVLTIVIMLYVTCSSTYLSLSNWKFIPFDCLLPRIPSLPNPVHSVFNKDNGTYSIPICQELLQLFSHELTYLTSMETLRCGSRPSG